MQKIEDIFKRIQETKRKQKEIREIYKDALSNSHEHQLLVEQIKKLRETKKGIENAIKSDFSGEFDKLDSLKIDIESDGVLLSDVALNSIIKGESIEIKDENNNEYEPIVSVKFRKV